ncbi:cerebellin-1-like isoform X2 [Alosa sapidissima]|uniref:cerebellin-1-like isoform X2 n=1 Tax=Alosa sapidissima TaxID=34773 RepID=UPI001C0849C8|nr:cerebellin-1-like isoform X2 [Alosa sapidissima]
MELSGEPVRDNRRQNKTLPEQGIYENTKPSTCKCYVDQPGFLKCMVAILTVLCITLGASMVTLHVYRQLSIGSQFEELKTEFKNIMRKLNDTTKEMDDRLTEFKDEQQEQKAELEQLETKCAGGGAKVAFSASLWETGEKRSDVSTILAYKHIFTNVGNAYDSNTGDFIAPVKGVYFFSFNTFGYSGSVSGAILTKNGQLMVSTYEFASSGDASDTTGNSIVLQLEAGERVSMILWENARVFDQRNGHNTFNGFLLFAL